MADWKPHADEKSKAHCLKCAICGALARDEMVALFIEGKCGNSHCKEAAEREAK